MELLGDGPDAREHIGDVEALRGALADVGSPFTPVREGAVAELVAGMDLASDLGAERVVVHPSSDAWDLGGTAGKARGFVQDSLDDLVPAARERGLVPCVESVVSSHYGVHAFPGLPERYAAAMTTSDTSHALLAGLDESGTAEFCRAHADRIGHLHPVDTRGGDDERLPVGMGRIEELLVPG